MPTMVRAGPGGGWEPGAQPRSLIREPIPRIIPIAFPVSTSAPELGMDTGTLILDVGTLTGLLTSPRISYNPSYNLTR